MRDNVKTVPTRRDFVKLALGTGAYLATAGCRRGARHASARGPHPVYWVQILLSGGHDTLFTTDPKVAGDVDSMVTLPQDDHITTAADLRLGPHLAPLARWGTSLAILNGVQVRTVNHETGQKQFFHLKTNIMAGRPTTLDSIASHRQGQPLGVAYLNLESRNMHSPSYFGTADAFYFGKGDVFEQIARTPPDELHTLAKVLRRQAAATDRSAGGSIAAAQTAAYYREVADFYERVADVPPLVSPQRSTDYVTQVMAESLDRAVWLIEHDLSCGVIVDLGMLGWDTHIRNESKQAEMNGNFARFFDEYLTKLHARKNQHGVLADNTVTVIGSELGRFPHQNDMLGKDHLSQTSFLMTGPGLRTGRTFGRTGRRMEGLPIAYRTGDPAEAGRVPLLDDLGATMIRLAGLDPEVYGYDGEVCEFLLDRTS